MGMPRHRAAIEGSPEEAARPSPGGPPFPDSPRSSGLRGAVWLLAIVLLTWLGLAHAWSSGYRATEAATIQAAQLPPEARQTLALIKRGGPFPYAKDGTVFGNRERLLPAQSRGYYREFTVKTPGSRDRGARRIVAGRSGDYWYTADHYRSFKRIRE